MPPPRDEDAPGIVIERAEIPGTGLVDLRVAAGRVTALVPHGAALPEGETLRVIDAKARALLPGLHDHHIHLLALAAALGSVRCGPPEVQDREALGAALRAAVPGEDGWIRGTGYHDSVAGPLGCALLDTLRADLPVRVQHRSGALWGVNSAGLQALGLEAEAPAPAGVERDPSGRPLGRLLRLDGWLRSRLGGRSAPALAPVGALLARYGVTGATDATPSNDGATLALFADARRHGVLPQQLLVMGSETLPASAPAHSEGVVPGPLKIWLADADLPSPDALRARIEAAHGQSRPVAIHCVTRAELVLAATALHEVGSLPGDRIEHASVAPAELLALLAPLEIAVVTQPNFIYERGDAYATEVEPADRPWLYRCRGFEDAGIPLGAGTDAPFGRPDPWRAMEAAVTRTSAGGRRLAPEEGLTPARALDLFTTPPEAPGGKPRRIEPGAPADLCLLDRAWQDASERLSEVRVAATLCRGSIVWEA